MAHIGDFAAVQAHGTLEHRLVSYELAEAASGGHATQIHLVRRL